MEILCGGNSIVRKNSISYITEALVYIPFTKLEMNLYVCWQYELKDRMSILWYCNELSKVVGFYDTVYIDNTINIDYVFMYYIAFPNITFLPHHIKLIRMSPKYGI